MRERERKHPTDSRFDGIIVSRILRGPKERENDLIKMARRIGFEDVSELVPWKEAFSDYSDEQLPGASLAGARHKDGLTQKQLADKLGIAQGYVSDMECGKRSIGKTMAKRLSKVLNINYKVFL
jgi:DNA-binding XRE family transcriptional regulator